MQNIADRALGRNQFETFTGEVVQQRRLPFAAQILKTRYGLADSIALVIAELAGYPIVTEA